MADAEGLGYIRILGRDTWAKAFLRLDTDNNAYLDFVDFPPGKSIRRRIGLRERRGPTSPAKPPRAAI